jgi:hypothetical protein
VTESSAFVSIVDAEVFTCDGVGLFAAGLQLVKKTAPNNKSETTRNNDVVRINNPFKTPLPWSN